MVSGVPAATRVLWGAVSKKENGEKPPALTEKEKQKQRNIKLRVAGVYYGRFVGRNVLDWWEVWKRSD